MKRLLIIFFLLFSHSLAAQTGRFEYGYHFNYSSLDASKTDLKDRSIQNGYPFGFYGKIQSEDTWFARISYSLPVETSQTEEFYQTIKVSNFSFVGCYKFRLSRNIKPFLGLAYESYDFETKDRYVLLDGQKDGDLEPIKGNITDIAVVVSTSTTVFELPVDIGFSNGQKLTKFYVSLPINGIF